MVTPFAGVWIEISSQVTPFAGVWIEISSKQNNTGRCEVTPFAGVWIEIKGHMGREI